MGSRKRIAMALGVNEVADLAQEIQLILKAKPPTIHEGFRALGGGIHLLHAQPKRLKEAACRDVQILDSDQTSNNTSLAPDQTSDITSRSSRPQMLKAEGRRTFHHFSQCAYTRSRKRCSQCWDVPDANFRWRTTAMHWQVHKVGARLPRKVYYQRGERVRSRRRGASVAIPRSLSLQPRRYPMDSMKFCLLDFCAKNRWTW